jgi:hypothetical protein
VKLRRDFYDERMYWNWGYNLRHWLFGVQWDGDGFYIAVGPFYVGRSDLPF